MDSWTTFGHVTLITQWWCPEYCIQPDILAYLRGAQKKMGKPYIHVMFYFHIFFIQVVVREGMAESYFIICCCWWWFWVTGAKNWIQNFHCGGHTIIKIQKSLFLFNVTLISSFLKDESMLLCLCHFRSMLLYVYLAQAFNSSTDFFKVLWLVCAPYSEHLSCPTISSTSPATSYWFTTWSVHLEFRPQNILAIFSSSDSRYRL